MTSNGADAISPGDIWNHNLSDRLAWAQYAPKLVDYAINLTSTFTPNGFWTSMGINGCANPYWNFCCTPATSLNALTLPATSARARGLEDRAPKL